MRRFQDLIAWQLAMELNDVVFEITDAGPPARDAEFRAPTGRWPPSRIS